VLGGGTSDAGGGGGGGLMGDLAGAALGDSGGGLLGTLLGLGGPGGGASTVETSGQVKIVADSRLNALVVQANPQDTELVEQLLEIIDQQNSPENVSTTPAPRLIPCLYTRAEEVASVVKQVYAGRISSGSSSQQRQPSPEELIRALRGGGRGGRSSESERARQEQQKMSVGVDERSNSLIVTAPDPLFEEVKQLVADLDRGGNESVETTRVITLRRANPATVQEALRSILGDSVSGGTTRSSSGAARPTGGAPSRTGGTGRPASGAEAAEQMRRNIEMMRQFQQNNPSGGGGFRPGGTGRSTRGR